MVSATAKSGVDARVMVLGEVHLAVVTVAEKVAVMVTETVLGAAAMEEAMAELVVWLGVAMARTMVVVGNDDSTRDGDS